jgi:hypothetical protein
VFPPLVSLYNTELKLVCTVAGKNVTEAAVDDAADSCDLAPVRNATPHARTSPLVPSPAEFGDVYSERILSKVRRYPLVQHVGKAVVFEIAVQGGAMLYTVSFA